MTGYCSVKSRERRNFLLDSLASYGGAILTPICVFVAVPVALRQLDAANAGKFLVILSFSRLISGFDFGIAQLATPRLRSFESQSRSRRSFCVSSISYLACLSVVGTIPMLLMALLSSTTILQSISFRDIIVLACLAFGFSLTTFAREFSGALKIYRITFLISCGASTFYLALVFKFSAKIAEVLGLALAAYLIIQAVAIIVLSSLNSRDQIVLTDDSAPKFVWRTALMMQAISVGNLATVQGPVVISSLLLDVEDVLQVAIAFQIASAVRLLGSSVSPFVLSQMSGMKNTEVFRMTSNARPYWIFTLLISSLFGVSFSAPVDRLLGADHLNETNYRSVVIWGVVWGAIALLPLIPITAFRNFLQLVPEMLLSAVSIASFFLLALGTWYTRSASVTLAISMCAIVLGAALAELLFIHFGKKLRTSLS